MANPMDRWIEQLANEVGVQQPGDVTDLLAVTREVAHNVSRPAAPLSLYLLGLAVGAGADRSELVAKVNELVERWEPDGRAD